MLLSSQQRLSSLQECRALEGESTLPTAGHSQAPAQHCGTASASKGTAAFPPAGHMLTMATSSSGRPWDGAKAWSKSHNFHQLRQQQSGQKAVMGTGYSWERWERQDRGWEWEEPALSQTQVEELLSWRETPRLTLSQQSLHRGTTWLSWAPGGQPGDAPLGAASCLDLSSPKDGDSTEVITQLYCMSKKQATSWGSSNTNHPLTKDRHFPSWPTFLWDNVD